MAQYVRISVRPRGFCRRAEASRDFARALQALAADSSVDYAPAAGELLAEFNADLAAATGIKQEIFFSRHEVRAMQDRLRVGSREMFGCRNLNLYRRCHEQEAACLNLRIHARPTSNICQIARTSMRGHDRWRTKLALQTSLKM